MLSSSKDSVARVIGLRIPLPRDPKRALCTTELAGQLNLDNIH